MLKWLLIPLGIATLILLGLPSLVIVGLICFIIPGLLMMAVPTAFVYLLATLTIRWSLRLPPSFGTTCLSFGLALCLGFAVMLPARLSETKRFQGACLPDICPEKPIALSGSILLDWAPITRSGKKEIECDFLCAGLLDTPGVTSVTRRTESGIAIFRRGENAPGSLVLPQNPEDILNAFRNHKANSNFRLARNDFKTEQRALKAQWALRIAEGDVLKREMVNESKDIDWTIQLTSSKVAGQPTSDRLEIIDKTGQVVARKSLVRHSIPALWFHFGFKLGSSADGFSGARFHVARDSRSNQQRYYQFKPEVELIGLAQIARPKAAENLVTQMEQKLLQALDNRQASEAELLLAPMWLSQFSYDAGDAGDAGEKELGIIASILLDDRISDPYELVSTALSSRANLTPLRAGLAYRYLRATNSKSKYWYIRTMTKLPAGTFARPTPDEQKIWDLALTQPEATPFLERLADQGENGVDQALTKLQEVLPRPWHARWQVLEGVRSAFARAGTTAATALPTIQQLMSQPRSPLLNSSNDREDWLVAMYLMGVALHDLPHRVGPLTPTELEIESTRVQKASIRFNKERGLF